MTAETDRQAGDRAGDFGVATTRLLAAQLGIRNYTVATAWKRWGPPLWRRETFKFPTDPELEAEICDVVGLYLDPPEKAVVLSGG